MSSRKIDHLRVAVNHGLSRLTSAKARHLEERKSRDKLKARTASLLEATAIAQAVAARVQSQAHAEIASIVTRCLAIFDEPYDFRITFERKRSRTEARLSFWRDGFEVDPVTASGGGVVLVAAFALRVACLILTRPRLRRVLILDEPFSMVSEDYRPKLRALLKSLARELGIQFVLVTHDRELRAGKVITLE